MNRNLTTFINYKYSHTHKNYVAIFNIHSWYVNDATDEQIS